jgi:hypothetical protein
MSDFINVAGENSLVRDKESGAILNTNKGEIYQAKARKKAKTQAKHELDNLKQDVSDMKIMLSKILEKIDGA